MPSTKKILQLKVFFDTNVIYNSSSSELLTKETSELIERYSTPTDIKISWHLPEIVMDERRFQMRKKGFELLLPIRKLEKLLGHNLMIDEQIICDRVNDAIDKNVIRHNIEIEKLAIEKVQWQEIINKASFRLPPFEDGDKEKGFRDALVLETVLQVIEKSPVSAKSCRIVFITNDKLLSNAFVSKTVSRKNVNLLPSISDLESLINVLDSQIKEDLVNEISQHAKELFFLPAVENTLYYKEKIGDIINQKFGEKLSEYPQSANRRENVQWWIGNPGFVKKIKQRVYWKTPITIDSKAIRLTYQPTSNLFENRPVGSSPNTIGSGLIGGSHNLGMSASLFASGFTPNLFPNNDPTQSIYGIGSILPTEETIATGKSKIEIIWSVTLTTKKIFKNPKVEAIDFIETIWT